MTDALMANDVIPDSSPPELTQFIFDANSDQIILSFDEPVQLTSFNVSGIVLDSEASPTSSPLQLSNGTIANLNLEVSSVVIINLVQADISIIKLRSDLVTSMNDTYISLFEGTVLDTVNNSNNDTSLRQVDIFTSDSMRPELVDFSLDIQAGHLVLTFNDVVNASTFDASAIAIQSSLWAMVGEVVLLTDSSESTSASGYEIEVQLSVEDHLALRDNQQVAISAATTWLTMQAFAIDDVFGLDVLAITDGKALNVGRYVPDMDPPILEEVVLDLNSGALRLRFSDLMAAESLLTGRITLHDFRLSGGQATRLEDGRSVELTLSSADIDHFVLASGANFTGSINFTAEQGYIRDLSGNAADSARTSISQVVEDETGPVILSYTLNMNDGILTATLSELGLASPFTPAFITIQGAENLTALAGLRYTLQTSTVLMGDSRTFVIALSNEDLNALKEDMSLATGRRDTFLTISGAALTDVFGNPVQNISSEAALQVVTFIRDTEPPSLTSFDLNLNQGTILLTFSETVTIEDITGLTIQDAATATISVTLSGGNISSEPSSIHAIALAAEDITQLQLQESLAVSNETTFLSVMSGAVIDTSGSSIVPIATGIRARHLIEDTMPPTLTSYSLDLDSGVLNLTFSEVINVGTFNGSLFQFSAAGSSVAITESLPAAVNSATLYIELTYTDLNIIKMHISQVGVVMLEHSYGAVQDMASNPIDNLTSGLSPQLFSPDITRPTVTTFNLDTSQSQIELVFDEYVNHTVFDVTAVMLVDQATTGTAAQVFGLTLNSVVTSISGEQIDIFIGVDDQIALASSSPVASSNITTFLVLLSQAAEDLAGNPSVPIRQPNPLPVNTFIPDDRRPLLLSFTLDFNVGELTLVFDEIVSGALPTNVEGITLHSSRLPGSQSYTITSGSTGAVLADDATSFVVSLSTDDQNNLTAVRGLAEDANTTFITIDDTVIRDASNNPVQSIAQAAALAVTTFIPDSNSPSLEGFSFDLDQGGVTLTFNETIEPLSVQAAGVVLLRDVVSNAAQVPLAGNGTSDQLGFEVTIQLMESVRNQLKSLDICTLITNCVISITETAINDTFGNPVLPVAPTQSVRVREVTPDETDPSLQLFAEFDLNQGLLTLSFSETVNISSFRLEELILQDYYGDSSALESVYSLTGGNIVTRDHSDVVTIQLSDSDLNAIKADEALCTAQDLCWIKFSSLFVQDIAERNVTPILNETFPNFNPFHAPAVFIPDTTRPNLTMFSINLSTGTVSLTFDEAVAAESLDAQHLFLQNAPDSNSSLNLISFTRPTGFVNGIQVTFGIIPSVLRMIKANLDLATVASDTWVFFTSGLIMDTSGNPVFPRNNISTVLMAGNYTPDGEPPTLVSFTEFHFTSKTVTLEFSEPVNELAINFTGVTFIAAPVLGSTSYSLTSGRVVSTAVDRTQVTFELTADDIKGIKLLFDNLATERADTWITFTAASFQDTAGNPITEVTVDNAIQVTRYIEDVTRPQLLSFDLDLNEGLLTFTFSDVIDYATVVPSGITIQDAADQRVDFITISGGTTNPPSDYVITLNISRDSLDAIKAVPALGTNVNNTFISLDASAFRSVTNFQVITVLPTEAIPASSITPDVIDPEVDSFTFNVSSGLLMIQFTEVINSTSFSQTTVTLQNAMNNAPLSRLLTGGTRLTNEPASRLLFALSEDDLNYIKQFESFGTNASNTFLAAERVTVLDMSGNELVAIPTNNAIQAMSLFEDVTPPQLVAFNLDMNVGHLTLSFSETISTPSLDVSRFILQGEETASVANMYRLTSSSTVVTVEHSNTVLVMLGATDLNAIKANPDIAFDENNTFLRFENDAVCDRNNRCIGGLPNGEAESVGMYVPDTNPPSITGFDVDLRDSTLTFFFNETVNASSFISDAILLMNTPNNHTAQFQIRLTDGSPLSSNGDTIRYQLGEDDVNLIKAEIQLFSNEANSFIAVSAGGVMDVQGNPLVEIPTNDALRASALSPDTVRPSLREFVLDLNANTLVLTFDETVRGTSLNVSAIELHSDMALIMSTVSHRLSADGAEVTPAIGFTLTIQLTTADINALKASPNLAVTTANTYLTLDAGAVIDMAEQNNSAIVTPQMAQAVIPDRTSPRLVNFYLTMPDPMPPVYLVLEFSETVRASSLQLDQFTLQSAADTSGTRYTLQTSMLRPSQIDSFMLQVEVSAPDLDGLRASPPIGQTVNSTYISFPEAAVRDMAGQLVEAVNETTALMATAVADFVPPQLTGFTFDLDQLQITLTFSEDVNSSSLIISNLRIQNMDGSMNYTLTDSTVEGTLNDLAIVTLSMMDEIILKNTMGLADSNTTTYIVLPVGSIKDLAGNEIEDTLSMVTTFISDTTSPKILTFDIDFETMIIMLTFDEPVNASTLDVRHMSLVNMQAFFPALAFSFTGVADVTTQNYNTHLSFALTEEDQNALQAIVGLAEDSTNTFLSVDPEALMDNSGNMVQRIPAWQALTAQMFGNDTVNPELLAFVLDLNTLNLILTFSETVNASTFNFSAVYLSSGTPGEVFYLTETTQSTGLVNVLRLRLATGDFNRLVLSPVCSSNTTCFISVRMGAVLDTVGLPLMARNDIPVSEWYQDMTRPRLAAFRRFDAVNGTITVVFDEPVQSLTFNGSGVTLHSFFANPASSLPLSYAPASSPDGESVTFSIAPEDLEAIRADNQLCTHRGNCYLTVNEGTVLDIAGLPNEETTLGSPSLVVTLFDMDVVSPVLEGFLFDLNSGQVVLQFSEPVSVESVDFTAVTIQEAQGTLSTVLSHTLTGGTVLNTAPSTYLNFSLTTMDLNRMKMVGLASSVNNTYVSITSLLTTDVAFIPNSITPRNPEAALQAQMFVWDTQGPLLQSITLDLDLNRIVLVFDEPVQTAFVAFVGITVLSDNSSMPNASFTLTNGTVLEVNMFSQTITVQLIRDDFSEIKLNSELGNSENDTFVSLASNSVLDISGVSNMEQTLNADRVVHDQTRPQLDYFIFDIENGVMNLTFTDVVVASTFDATAFTLQNARTATQRITLTNSTGTTSPNGYQISVAFSSDDLLRLKLTPGLAKNINNTYLTMQAFAIDDLQGLDALAVTDGKAYQAVDYIPDEAPPILTAFDVDITAGTLTLSFNEAVNRSTLLAPSLTIASNVSGTFGYTLTSLESIELSSDAQIVYAMFSIADLNLIKNMTEIATSETNTVLLADFGWIEDLVANKADQITGQVVSSFMNDSLAPVILSYTLDMNLGQLVLSFSETVRSDTVSFAAYSLQPQYNSTLVPTRVHSLTDATVQSQALNVIVIDFSEVDHFAINAIPQLATSAMTTFISVLPSGASDTTGNAIDTIFIGAGLVADSYIADSVPPNLLGFTLNLNENVLSLTFDEVVRGQSVNTSGITIQSTAIDSGATLSLTLSGGSPDDVFASVINVTLSLADKAMLDSTSGLAESSINTFLAASSGAVLDTSPLNGGNPLVEIPTRAARRISEEVVLDSTPPLLQGFVLNLSDISATLTFSEYIDVSAIDFEGLQVENRASGATVSVPLMNSLLAEGQNNSNIVRITLDPLDFKSIQEAAPNIATFNGNTFLRISTNSITDLSMNFFVEETLAVQVTQLVADVRPPELITFVLSKGLRRLVLTFTEPLLFSSINYDELMLRNSISSLAFGIPNTVKFAEDLNQDGTVLTININSTDFDNLNANDIATLVNNTFLFFSSAFAEDLAENRIRAILNSEAQQVLAIADDQLPPSLDMFTLNLNTGILRLDFTETVLDTSFNVSGLALRNAVSSPSVTIPITSDSIVVVGPTVTLQLTSETLNAIKGDSSIGNNRQDTFITMEASTAEDFDNMQVVAILSSAALAASFVESDTTGPTLDGFDMNMDTGEVVLSFSELVRTSSFVTSSVTLQSTSNSSTTSINLASAIFTPSSVALPNVPITLPMGLLNEIKQVNLCRDNLTCYITIAASVVQDVFGFDNSARTSDNAAVVVNFVPDRTPPSYMTIDLFDLESGVLNITFDEPLNAETFNFSQLYVQDTLAEQPETAFVNLENSTIIGLIGRQYSFQLTDEIITAIKREQSLCTRQLDCFVRFTNGFVMDVFDNMARPLDDSAAFNSLPSQFVNDMRDPNVTGFSIDLNAGQLILFFDEVVEANTFRPTEVTFVPSVTANKSEGVTLTTTNVITNEVTDRVVVTLSDVDIQSIQANLELGTTGENTFLLFSSDMIRDAAGRSVIPRLVGDALPVTTFVPDNVPPTLLQFSVIDFNSGTISLSFSEPILETTVNAMRVELSSDQSGGTVLNLTSFANVTGQQSRTLLVLSFSEEDLREIQRIPELAFDQQSTFIKVYQGAFFDVTNNPVDESARLPAPAYIPDTTPPMLLNYTLDLDQGAILFTFTEVVQDTALMAAELTFYSSNASVVSAAEMLQLSGGTIQNGPSHTPELRLDDFDLNLLKSMDQLATSVNDTYISFSGLFIRDMARPGIQVTPVIRQQADGYIGDMTRPSLLSYSFNLSSGIVVLVFSEYINSSNFQPTQITIQSSVNRLDPSADSRILSGGSLLPASSLQEIVLQLVPEDIDHLRSTMGIAEVLNNTFLSATENLVTDGAGNLFHAIPGNSAVGASNFTLDTVPPSLMSFNFDLNKGVLELTFNEAVVADSFQPTLLLLTSPTGSRYTVQDATSEPVDITAIRVQLSQTDLNAIKADTELALSNDTTGILPQYDLVRDSSNNSLLASSSAVYARTYVGDTEKPLLQGFVLDLTARALLLTFNETIDARNIIFSEIFLQNRAEGGGDMISMDTSFTNSSNAPEIAITFSLQVISAIKANAVLGTEVDNTFISFSESAFRDPSGNPVIPLSSRNALRASNHTADSAPPVLLAYTVDPNDDTLTLTFDEVVDGNSFNFSLFTLFSTDDLNATNYTLTGGTVTAIDNSVVTITFDFDDITALKIGSFVSVDGTFLMLGSGAVADTNGNVLEATQRIQGPFIRDTTPPELTQFDVLMQGGTEPLEIVLHFSEAVAADGLTSTLQRIRLQASTTFDARTDVTLSGGDVLVGNMVDITLIVSANDLADIRTSPPLCQSNATCYLDVSSSLVEDTSEVPMAVPSTPLSPSLFTADLVRPILSAFSFNVDNGLLNLTFSEAVNGSTLNPAGLYLQGAVDSNTFSLQLAGSTVETVIVSEEISVTVSAQVLDTLKVLPQLASSPSTTFLTLDAASTGLSDIANNLVADVPSSNAIRVTTYIADMVPPTLTSFSVNMDGGSVDFVFNEGVDINVTIPTRITFTNADGSSSYTLTAGSSNQLFAPSFTWELTTEDHNQLKARTDLATDITNTFLTLQQGAFSDAAGNPIAPISRVPASGFIKDFGNPILLTFDMNVNQSTLVLHFDETVNVSSLMVSEMLLSDGSGATYALNTSASNQGPSPDVTVSISFADLNALKARRICLTNITCFLTFSEALIEDMVNSSVVPRSLVPVGDYTADLASPQLTAFTEIDLVQGTISLEFSETIDSSTFNATGLRLQSLFVREQFTSELNITDGTLLTGDSTIVTFQLSPADFTALRDSPELCDRRAHCYIVADSVTIRDVSGHALSPVQEVSPGFIVQAFIYDIRMPELLHFDLDMDIGLLTLEFSEPMAVESFQYEGITLLSSVNATAEERFTLVTMDVFTNSSNGDMLVNIYILPPSLNDLKALGNVASTMDNTYLSIQPTAATDAAIEPNRVMAILPSSPQRVRAYNSDSTPPQLVSFLVDLNDNSIVFNFDEPVLTNSVLLDQVVISNSSISPVFNHSLTGGVVRERSMATSTTITADLLREDIQALKSMAGFASHENETYLGFSLGTFEDTSNNQIEPLFGHKAFLLTPDSTRVRLLSFSVNIEDATLVLTFDDVVQSSSFDASAIALLNGVSASEANTVQLTRLTRTNSPNGFEITAYIHSSDLLRIKLAENVASELNDSYITFQAFGIKDTNGLNVLAVTNGSAIQASGYVGDSSPPSLTSFVLDLNSGFVRLSFNDFVNPSTFIPSSVALHSSSVGGLQFTLAAESVTRSVDGLTLEVQLTSDLLDSIKGEPALGSSSANTFVSVEAAAVEDLAGNNVTALSTRLAAGSVIPDAVPPEIVAFELDLNEGIITLNFTEIVQPSSLDLQGIALQPRIDSSQVPGQIFTFNPGTVLEVCSAVTTIHT